MVIEEGTGLVLAYLLVSAGVIIIFLVAVLVVGWFVGRTGIPFSKRTTVQLR
jgi:hypothetical protein